MLLAGTPYTSIPQLKFIPSPRQVHPTHQCNIYIYIYKRLCMYSQTVVLVVGCLRQQQGETMQCGGRPSCFSEVLHCIRLGFYGANCTTSWLLFLMSEWLFCAPGNHRMVVTPTLAVSVLTQGFGLAGLSGTRECLNEGKLACIVL